MTLPQTLVLASTSRYRAQLLERLAVPFVQCAPHVDESERGNEGGADRALRLAIAKADAVAAEPGKLVVGSDQVATLDGAILHKPGSVERAQEQLRASSGREVLFHTAVSVRDPRDGKHHTHVDVTTVHFRVLDETTIDRYVGHDMPLDCAGSFKCEGLGIALFDRIDTRDPTALVGLPLIALARLLRKLGLDLP
ncbi:MAG: Maf family nucleotide pyrophosphatase [Rhodanobacter sp.]